MRIKVYVGIKHGEVVISGSLVSCDMFYIIIENRYMIYYTRPMKRSYNKRKSWVSEVIIHSGNIDTWNNGNYKKPLGITKIDSDFTTNFDYTEYELSRYHVMYLLLMTKHPEYAKEYLE